MDPLSLAGSFAAIVGLLSNFKAERSSADLTSFIAWLREQHQEGFANAIASNQALSSELSGLLTTKHEELVARLDHLNNQILAVAQSVEGFGSLANLLSSSIVLSPQAISLLKQMASSKAKYVMEHKRLSESAFLFIDGAVGELQVQEPRFIEDDLTSLLTAGLLRLEIASKGSRKFFVTRAGAQLANSHVGKQL